MEANTRTDLRDLKLVSQPQVLELFGVSPMTLWRWRKDKSFPQEIRVQKRIFFRMSEIAQFLEDKTVPDDVGI